MHATHQCERGQHKKSGGQHQPVRQNKGLEGRGWGRVLNRRAGIAPYHGQRQRRGQHRKQHGQVKGIEHGQVRPGVRRPGQRHAEHRQVDHLAAHQQHTGGQVGLRMGRHRPGRAVAEAPHQQGHHANHSGRGGRSPGPGSDLVCPPPGFQRQHQRQQQQRTEMPDVDEWVISFIHHAQQVSLHAPGRRPGQPAQAQQEMLVLPLVWERKQRQKRQKYDRRMAHRIPLPGPAQPGAGAETRAQEQQENRQLPERGQPIFRFLPAGAQPPQCGPHEQANGNDPVGHLKALLLRRLELSRGEKCAQADQQTAQHIAIQNRQPGIRPPAMFQEGEPTEQDQGGTGQLGQLPALAGADPDQRRTFQRPGGRSPARVERQRNGDGGEGHRQRHVRFNHQAQPGRLAAEQPGGGECVEHRDGGCADGQPVLRVADQGGLQGKRDDRCAKNQGAIDDADAFRRLAQGVQNGDGLVEQEMQQQERLRAGPQFGCVVLVTPQTADQEGKDEADQVQFTPGTEPGNAENGAIEHQVIAEQRDMAALAGGSQHRRQEAADNAENGQRSRVLQHRQGAGAGR